MASVEADHEDGVLRPVKPMRLRPGERVHLIVRRRSDPARWDLERFVKGGGEEDLELASAGLGDWERSLQDKEER